jgi:hypothetical protein
MENYAVVIVPFVTELFYQQKSLYRQKENEKHDPYYQRWVALRKTESDKSPQNADNQNCGQIFPNSLCA